MGVILHREAEVSREALLGPTPPNLVPKCPEPAVSTTAVSVRLQVWWDGQETHQGLSFNNVLPVLFSFKGLSTYFEIILDLPNIPQISITWLPLLLPSHITTIQQSTPGN